jgi:hypothetical protein
MSISSTGESLIDFKRKLLKVLTKFAVNHTIHIA